jgi:spore coat polysaccharide biosynthesis predicted glycosyltransferase SpsG
VRLIIRADASVSVGTGHVMRSSTIAAEFLQLGHAVCYVGTIDPMSLILERFQEVGLTYPPKKPADFQPDHKNDILLIDSYTLNPSDPFIAKENWLKVVSIHDSVTPNYDVDLVIKPSLTSLPNPRDRIRTLSGAQFILLRNSVTKTYPRDPNDSTPLRVLVAGGGSDPSGFCNEVIKVLRELPFNFMANVFSDNIDLTHMADSRIKTHQVSLLLDEFAKDCDLALTLASSLSTELLAREIPIGVACAFENQRSGFIEMVSSGFAAPIGELDNSGEWHFDKVAIGQLLSSNTFRANLRSRVSGLIDLKGPKRVALEILQL